MAQESTVAKQQHERFIKDVCKSGIVWGLDSKSGYATSGSNDYEDAEGNPLSVICIWSSKDMAVLCAKEDWAEFEPVEVPLDEFIENWCVGMFENSMLAGTNFGENMFGVESNPLDLIVELAKELKKIRKIIPLKLYKGMDDLLREIDLLNKE